MTTNHFWRPLQALTGAVVIATGALSGPAIAQDLTIAGGSIGGTWSVIGNAIADYSHKEIDGVRTTVIAGGGVKNILGLATNQIQIGFAYSSTAGEAIKGIGAFKDKPTKAAAMVGFYNAPWQLAVLKSSDIKTVKDLKGKRIAPGIKGFTGEIIARMVLQVNALSYDDMKRVELIDYNDAVQLIKDGHMDAFMPIAADPTPSIQDLASSAGGVRIVPISDEELAAIREINPGYGRYTIEPGTYMGQDEAVGTLGTNTVIYVAPDMEADLVEKILDVIDRHIGDLQTLHPLMKNFSLKDAVNDLGAPLHPGAEAFYKKKGIL